MVVLMAYGGESMQYTKVVKSQNSNGLGRLDCYQGTTIVATFDGISDFSGYALTNEDGTPADYAAPRLSETEKLRNDVDMLLITQLTMEGIIE